jgi:uncharacterized protein
MKKLLVASLVAMSLLVGIWPTAHAADVDLVTDRGGILTDSQLDELNQRAEEISATYNCDVVVYTVRRMTDNQGAYEWAVSAYLDHDFGRGSDRSGVMLFLSVTDREYALIGHGYGNTAFTDYGKDLILDDAVLPYLRDDRFFDAFSVYLDKADEFLRAAKQGKPIDKPTGPTTPSGPGSYETPTPWGRIAATVLIPLIASTIITLVWKGQMKTARKATAADTYVEGHGLVLTAQHDQFTHRTQTRTPISSSDSSSSSFSSSGGGTTVDSRGFSGRSGSF